MRIKEDGFELDGLLVDFTADYMSGEEDVGLREGWYVTVEDVYVVIESELLLTGEEEVRVSTYNEEAIEEAIIKHIER